MPTDQSETCSAMFTALDPYSPRRDYEAAFKGLVHRLIQTHDSLTDPVDRAKLWAAITTPIPGARK